MTLGNCPLGGVPRDEAHSTNPLTTRYSSRQATIHSCTKHQGLLPHRPQVSQLLHIFITRTGEGYVRARTSRDNYLLNVPAIQGQGPTPGFITFGQDDGKGRLSSRGGSLHDGFDGSGGSGEHLAFLCLSDRIQCQETTVTVLTVLVVRRLWRFRS